MSKKSMMKLDALTEMLDKIDMTPFPISDKELCDRYEALYTGAINDVLREKLLMDQALPITILLFYLDIQELQVHKQRGYLEFRARLKCF